MTHRLLLSLAAVTLLLGSVGCDARRGGSGGGDDDDDVVIGMGGLDTDGDGTLTDEDVGSGDVATFYRTTGGDSESETGAETDGWLSSGDGAWGLGMELGGDFPMSVVIWFQSPNSDGWDLTEGRGSIQWVSASSSEWLVWADATEGDIVITDVTETWASGWLDGSIEILIADQFESPTGDRVIIEGAAFNQLSYGE